MKQQERPVSRPTLRRHGRTRLSAGNRLILPAAVLAAAGLKPGDEVQVDVLGPGRLTVMRVEDPWEKWAGFLSGVFEPGYLEKLRRE